MSFEEIKRYDPIMRENQLFKRHQRVLQALDLSYQVAAEI